MPLYRAELLAKKPLRYAALIHDVSQVLHLPFDYDDGSKARDRSGYNNHGTIYGPVEVAGKIGMARSFDGTDDYVGIPHDASLDLPTALTAMAWVKRKTTGVLHGIFSQWETLRRWWLRILAGNRLEFCFSEDGTWDRYDTLLSVATIGTEWTHIVVTFDNGLIKLYINGKLDNQKLSTYTSIFTGVDVTRIGYGYIEYDPFDGIIDEVRICNRPLSLDEIRMLMDRRFV